jgi:hypothetical protein
VRETAEIAEEDEAAEIAEKKKREWSTNHTNKV